MIEKTNSIPCILLVKEQYLETEESFLESCLASTPILESKTGKVTVGETVPYDQSIVKRALHIIRDPFDNIVSRFHHAHKSHKNNKDFVSRFPKNNDGFQEWCKEMDSQYGEEERALWDKEVFRSSRNVPCHSEFFRYIQWHNLAFSTLKGMNIPTLFVTYEDYGKNFDVNLFSILNFLELKLENNITDFHRGDYSKYYSLEQRIAAMDMMRFQASEITWEKMKPYRFKVDQLQHEGNNFSQ